MCMYIFNFVTTEIRDVFRIQSNVYDGAFLLKQKRLKAVNYFRKKSSIADVGVCSKFHVETKLFENEQLTEILTAITGTSTFPCLRSLLKKLFQDVHTVIICCIARKHRKIVAPWKLKHSETHFGLVGHNCTDSKTNVKRILSVDNFSQNRKKNVFRGIPQIYLMLHKKNHACSSFLNFMTKKN